MNKKIILLRLIETALLVIFTYSISISNTSTQASWGILSFNFGFRIGSVPSSLHFTTLSSGFAISLFTSLLLFRRVKFTRLLGPLVIAGFGLLDSISNSVAALGGSFIPFGITLPLILCVMDWVITFKIRGSLAGHAGMNGIIVMLLALSVVIAASFPLWIINRTIQIRTEACELFVQKEVVNWISQFDREHFESIRHSQLIENTGGASAFNAMWSSLSALGPYEEPRITGKNVSLIYEENKGVLGGSYCDITTRSPNLPADVYFRIYCREERGVWTLAGFHVSDEAPES